MFDRVQPGIPWWYWFSGPEGLVVHRVIRDGSGSLWIDSQRLGDTGLRAIEPVKPVSFLEARTTVQLPQSDRYMKVVNQDLGIWWLDTSRKTTYVHFFEKHPSEGSNWYYGVSICGMKRRVKSGMIVSGSVLGIETVRCATCVKLSEKMKEANRADR